MKVSKFKVGPVAESIPFDNDGIKFNSENLQDVAEELRGNTVLSIENLTSTLNGNHDILANDSNLHVVSGTATGYSVTLPNATTLFKGRRFEILNTNIETVEVKDNGGNVLATLITDDNITLTLEDTITSNGNWITTVVTTAATGIISYVVETDTMFMTSSSTDVLITGFTVTPVTGRYAVWFSSDIDISQNNRLADCTIYSDGVASADTKRTVQGVSSNFNSNFQTLGEVIVNGSQMVDVRVAITAGNLTINGRTLLLIRLGA